MRFTNSFAPISQRYLNCTVLFVWLEIEIHLPRTCIHNVTFRNGLCHFHQKQGIPNTNFCKMRDVRFTNTSVVVRHFYPLVI